MTSSEGYGSSYPPVTPAAGYPPVTPPAGYPPYSPGGQPPLVPPTGFGPRDDSDLTGDSAPRAWDTTTSVPSWTPPSATDDKPSTTDAVKDEAASVAGGAAEAAKNVAGTAKEQVGNVVSEAKYQVQNLMGQARSELTDQAQVQQQRVAGGLHAVGDQLKAMATGSDQPGVATDFAYQAADKAHQVAEWLENRDPGSVLDEVRSFARQRPGAFLALALGAGLVTGRLVRGLTADTDTAQGTSNDTSADRSALVSSTQVRPALPAVGTSVGNAGDTSVGNTGGTSFGTAAGTTGQPYGEPIGWSEAR